MSSRKSRATVSRRGSSLSAWPPSPLAAQMARAGYVRRSSAGARQGGSEARMAAIGPGRTTWAISPDGKLTSPGRRAAQVLPGS